MNYNAKEVETINIKDEEEIKGIKEINELKPHLTQKVESLVLLYQTSKELDESNTEEIFNRIFEIYEPIIKRFSYRKQDEDLYAELLSILWRAVETYNFEGGTKFNTYFWVCVHNHLKCLNVKNNALKRISDKNLVYLNKTTINENGNETELFLPDLNAENEFSEMMFSSFLQKSIYPHLKDNEIDAIKMLLNGYTLDEIGRYLNNISAPGVHVKLRRLAKNKKIKSQFKNRI